MMRFTISNKIEIQGAPAQLIEILKDHLTMANPAFAEAKKRGRWTGNIEPQLSFYEDIPGGISLPRGYARQALELIEKHTGKRPHIIDQRRTCPSVDFAFKGKLRPYQDEAVRDIIARDFGVLEAATGSGKTVVALAVIGARRQPTLVLCHSKELLYQWQDRIKSFLGVEAGLLGDGNYKLAPVTVGIINTARKYLDELPQHFGQVIIDETHRTPCSMFTEVVSSFDCRYQLGLSATLCRRDGLTRLIYLYVGDRVHKVDPARLRAEGAVLKPEIIHRYTDFQYSFKDDYQAMLTALTENEARNYQIASDVVKEVSQGSGVVLVTDRAAHCKCLAGLLRAEGVKLEVLTGKVSSKKRTEIVAAVQNGDTQVLVSTLQLISEGFDCPGLASLFLGTPVKFSGRLLQVMGRILRPMEGKQARVFDYIDRVGVLRASARTRQRTYNKLARAA
jgi:superfamily II DNA or RNA helicase